MAAVKIKKISGDFQRARLNTALTDELIVEVVDGADVAVAGVDVLFQFNSAPLEATGQVLTGNVLTLTVPTDINGEAAVALTLGNMAGQYVISASSAGLVDSPLLFTEIAVPLNSIVSLNLVKSYLKIDSTDTAQDVLLQSYINLISSKIEEFIRGPVVEQNYPDELYNGDGQRILYPYHWPITDLLTNAVDANNLVEDIQYRITPIGAWINFIANRQYVLIDPNRPWYIELWAWAFPGGRQNIKVSYKAGYRTIPEQINQVCMEAAVEMYKESQASGIGRLGRKAVSKNTSGVGTSTDTYYELENRHKGMLEQFRKPII